MILVVKLLGTSKGPLITVFAHHVKLVRKSKMNNGWSCLYAKYEETKDGKKIPNVQKPWDITDRTWNGGQEGLENQEKGYLPKGEDRSAARNGQ